MMKKILIGIPNRGSLLTRFVENLMKLELPKDYETEFKFVSSYNVDLNRNNLAKEIYGNENYEYLLFIDDDIIMPHDTLIKLLESPSKITSGVYRFKDTTGDPHSPVIMPINKVHGKRFGRIREQEFLNLKETQRYILTEGIGLGCCLIHRTVFDILPFPYFNFHQGDHATSGIGEDLHFCRLVYYYLPATKIFVDTQVICKHIMTIYNEI
jgi:hypothetical protein